MPLDGIDGFWKAIRHKKRPQLEGEEGKFWLIWVGFFQQWAEVKRIPVFGYGPVVDPISVCEEKRLIFDGCFFPLTTVVVDTMAVYSAESDGPYLSRLILKSSLEVGPGTGLVFRYYLEPVERREYSITLYLISNSSRVRIS